MNIKFTAAFLKTFATSTSFGIGRFFKNKIVTAFAAYFILTRKRAGVGVFVPKSFVKIVFIFLSFFNGIPRPSFLNGIRAFILLLRYLFIYTSTTYLSYYPFLYSFICYTVY